MKRASQERRAEIEHVVRSCVVAALGVGSHELRDDYLIADGATVDSLTLLEVVVAVEDALQIVVPEREVTRLRTYGDLVRLATQLCDGAALSAALRERHGPMGYGPGGLVVRTGPLTRTTELTPYAAETILEDALAAGPAASVDLYVAPATSDEVLAGLERLFEKARQRGIEVHVTRRAPELPLMDERRAGGL